MSLAWQLPQLVLISFAEILVSVTGLELAYSQAPPDLRSVENWVGSIYCYYSGSSVVHTAK